MNHIRDVIHSTIDSTQTLSDKLKITHTRNYLLRARTTTVNNTNEISHPGGWAVKAGAGVPSRGKVDEPRPSGLRTRSSNKGKYSGTNYKTRPQL
eukprot:3826965-Heterocapsa_arctica.AAC.1